jgi:hypothetical protein
LSAQKEFSDAIASSPLEVEEESSSVAAGSLQSVHRTADESCSTTFDDLAIG